MISADQLADALGLTPSEAAIVARLAARKVWVDAAVLNECTAAASRKFDHAAGVRRIGALRVHVHNIRWKLGQDAILCMEGRGYTLGAPGVLAVKRVTALLGSNREEIRHAGVDIGAS